MSNDLIAEQHARVQGWLQKESSWNLALWMRSVHPADVAEVLGILDRSELEELVRLVGEELGGTCALSEILWEVDEGVRRTILDILPGEALVKIIEDFPSDQAVELLEGLERQEAHELLSRLKPDDAASLRDQLMYDEETAGRLMDTRYVAVSEHAFAAEAIEMVREGAEEVPDVHNVYVVDDGGRLVGVLSLRRLLLARPGMPISQIMQRDVISVRDDLDQEEVARAVSKYDLVTVPVVDRAGNLLGRITIDDIIDVIEEEASEDISRMAGTDERELTEDSVVRVARLRLPWLLASLLGSIATGTVLSRFEVTLGTTIALVFFVPVIMAMAGNIGIQSSAIVIRGLATGEIHVLEMSRRVFREMRIGVTMGLACGGIAGVVALLWLGDASIGIIVGLAMIIVITIAATVGALTPMICKRVGVDPAIAAGPFVTTSNDIMAISVYLGLATFLLRLTP